MAKNVRVRFSPEITEDMGVIAGFLSRRYSRTIPTMGPGRRLTNIYGQWTGDGSMDLTESVPHDFSVSITYEDAHGTEFLDVYELSVLTLRNQTTSTPSTTNDKGVQRRLVRALEEIARGVHR